MKTNRSSLKLATGMTVAASFAMGSLAHAADNPFSMQKLDGGYQLAQADKKADGKCGEGKCGGTRKAEEKKPADKNADAKCGAKSKDGSCGGAKAEDKKKDGKCGEAKCGANKK